MLQFYFGNVVSYVAPLLIINYKDCPSHNVVALPFLLLGDNNMFVSLIGVMFFSMTMSVTLAVLVSVLPKTPGLAFGFTTIGLFLGATPVFFFKITDLAVNCIMLTVMTAICLVCLLISIRKDESHESVD